MMAIAVALLAACVATTHLRAQTPASKRSAATPTTQNPPSRGRRCKAMCRPTVVLATPWVSPHGKDPTAIRHRAIYEKFCDGCASQRPDVVHVARSGDVGITYNMMTIASPGAAPRRVSYLSVWKRNSASDPWKLAIE